MREEWVDLDRPLNSWLDHLKWLLDFWYSVVGPKYRKGVEEHGGDLHLKPQDEKAVEELADLFCYFPTMLRHNSMIQAEVEFARKQLNDATDKLVIDADIEEALNIISRAKKALKRASYIRRYGNPGGKEVKGS